MLIPILIDPISFRIERTVTVKVRVFLFGALIGVTFGAEQLRFEPTTSVELSNETRLRGTSLNSFGAETLQVKSKSVTYKELKNSRRMKGAIAFDKLVKVL